MVSTEMVLLNAMLVVLETLRSALTCVSVGPMYDQGQGNKEVIRTLSLNGADLELLRQLLAQLLAQPVDPEANSAGEGGLRPSPNAASLVKLARQILRARRRRTNFFNRAMFGEPAWDMLLALYAADADGPRLAVGRLSVASGAPPTTALRWLDYLEKERLVVRQSNPTDARSEFVALSDKGRSTVEQYLCETINSDV